MQIKVKVKVSTRLTFTTQLTSTHAYLLNRVLSPLLSALPRNAANPGQKLRIGSAENGSEDKLQAQIQIQPQSQAQEKAMEERRRY